LDTQDTPAAAARINPTAACVLGLLSLGPAPGQPGYGSDVDAGMTGSQIWRAAATSIARFWNVTRSQVFRELPGLEARGLVAPGGRLSRRRQPYRITPEGRRHLRDWLADFVAGGPREEQLHSPLVLSVFFGELVPRDVLRSALGEHRALHVARLTALQAMARVLAGSNRLPASTVARGLAYQQLTIDWIDAVLRGEMGV
jgi:DNA-binding PadR family transcriptional regulator